MEDWENVIIDNDFDNRDRLGLSQCTMMTLSQGLFIRRSGRPPEYIRRKPDHLDLGGAPTMADDSTEPLPAAAERSAAPRGAGRRRPSIGARGSAALPLRADTLAGAPHYRRHFPTRNPDKGMSAAAAALCNLHG